MRHSLKYKPNIHINIITKQNYIEITVHPVHPI
jgi:hypothetical protein